MAITGDPNATAIITYRGVALSMGDCFTRFTPGDLSDTYEVVGQFIGIDSNESFSGITGAVRASAEAFLATVLAGVGGITKLQEIDGPKGKVLIPPGSAITDGLPARTLHNPFTSVDITNLWLTGASQSDGGGNYFEVTFTFQKLKTQAGDGSSAGTVSFTPQGGSAVPIGNRGGLVEVEANGSGYSIRVSAQYTKDGQTGGTLDPLPYYKAMLDSLKLSRFVASEMPRASAGSKTAFRSYDPNAKGTLDWTGAGSFTNAILESASFRQNHPGIYDINLSFVGSR